MPWIADEFEQFTHTVALYAEVLRNNAQIRQLLLQAAEQLLGPGPTIHLPLRASAAP